MKKAILVICITIFWLGAKAQSNKPDTAVVNFVTNATKGGIMEVVSGKLAQKKGKSEEVRNFGAKMVADHTKANAELKDIVARKKWSITQTPAAAAMPDAMLGSSTGTAFDKDYLVMMVKDHKKTVQLFQRASETSPDPQIKAFATKTLPILNEHYREVQRIADKLNIVYEK